eukprot:TRINITY_DN10477_c0_g1_i1.p1 TRINITY_DN10477_c0_g1~~TRINITY_DN10477_c0_g1_i1.p1  ORF type:complete len:263 (-),score=36.93 TRINITY_DN10477_c0_g1_i1:42-722(-)
MAKNWRLVRIFTLAKRLKVAKIDDIQLIQYLAILLVPDIIILVAWLYLDPPSPTVTIGASVLDKYLYCQSKNNSWIGIVLIEPIIMVIAGAFLSFKTKQLPAQFRETYYMAIATYLSSFVCILVPLAIFIPSPETLAIISCFGIIFGCVGMLAPMFLTKLYIIYMEGGKDTHPPVTSTNTPMSKVGSQTTSMDSENVEAAYKELKAQYDELKTKYEELLAKTNATQ